MSPGETPIARELVLLGGGHSHALALRMLGMNPLQGVQVTVVSDVTQAPYSGMLPGFIAGIYSYEEVHIDLRRLCQFAGVRFIHAAATGLDLDRRRVLLDSRGPVHFDRLSINIGSTPETNAVPGAAQFATPAKPVPLLLEKWSTLLAEHAKRSDWAPQIVLVGGGAGGVELALCMQQRLGGRVKVTLVHQQAELLATHNPGVRAKLSQLLAERGITVHTNTRVSELGADGIVTESGDTLRTDHVFWVTNASPAPWLTDSGLALDANGFVAVNDFLQSPSHPFVFAAGDVATVENQPRPKSGVFAVRAATPLLENLRRSLRGDTLKQWRAQKGFLSLIGTATREAVASRRFLSWQSPLAWKLKDWIDRRFMRKFQVFPEMRQTDATNSAPGTSDSLPAALTELKVRAQMRCLGCAAKLGSSVLSEALDRIRAEFPDTVADLFEPDDAADLPLPSEKHLVQTIDYMPALVADPYLFARILTLHCFSDIFAMGARPHSALAATLIPFSADSVATETLYQLLSGIAATLSEMDAKLVGGHTAEGTQLAVALACNGLIDPDRALRKKGMQPGDALILTKALGTGTLFAAEMRLKADGAWIDAALESMSTSNQHASEILFECGATACTDVTGFGLAGHLLEMTRASGTTAMLDLDALPILPGALKTSQSGILSSLHPQNARAINAIANASDFADHAKLALLFDPQTSGGLLASVPRNNADNSLASLPDSVIIGSVESGDDQNASIFLR